MLMHGAVPQPPGNGVWFDIVAVPATDFMEPQISDSHQAASQDPSTEIAENIVATEDPYMPIPRKKRKKKKRSLTQKKKKKRSLKKKKKRRRNGAL